MLRGEQLSKEDDSDVLECRGGVRAHFAKRVKLTTYDVENLIGMGSCKVV